MLSILCYTSMFYADVDMQDRVAAPNQRAPSMHPRDRLMHLLVAVLRRPTTTLDYLACYCGGYDDYGICRSFDPAVIYLPLIISRFDLRLRRAFSCFLKSSQAS
jgi:hypothetical protein